jgi:hypothetical protein
MENSSAPSPRRTLRELLQDASKEKDNTKLISLLGEVTDAFDRGDRVGEAENDG